MGVTGKGEIIKLVLVRHREGGRGYVFEAPLGADIRVGDTVVCKLHDGNITYGIAEACTEVPKCSMAYRFIMLCNGATEPLSKIIGKYKYISY